MIKTPKRTFAGVSNTMVKRKKRRLSIADLPINGRSELSRSNKQPEMAD
jgi:hypothetical protein